MVDLPPARLDTPNFIDIIWWKHWIYGLLEVDVTIARQFIEEFKVRTGEGLSFTGYLVFCLARAVNEYRSVQAKPVPPDKGMPPLMRSFMLLPEPIPKLYIALVRA